MHEELVKRLRKEASYWCANCCYRAGDCICFAPNDRKKDCDVYTKLQAADAIVKLQDTVQAQDKALKLCADQLARRWTPVTERLPKGADKSGELCENVWLFFDDGNVYPGWMNGITEKVYYLDNYSDSLMKAPISRVKMWQSKPEPPEG